jgi:lactate dehydrogenase-like 2-hydroxyacid dehydrogenase
LREVKNDKQQKQTRHIISTKEFEQMKKGVVIVNTARGAVMDEAALVTALEKGQVWSCGLDVFEEEPKVHSGLVWAVPLSFQNLSRFSDIQVLYLLNVP